MNLNSKIFYEFNNHTNLKFFLEKSYSFELLLLLMNKDKFSKTQLHDNICSKKPRIDAFDHYINRLVTNNILIKQRSMNKKSEVCISLVKEVYNEAYAILYNKSK